MAVKSLAALAAATMLAAPASPVESGPGTEIYAGPPPARFVSEVGGVVLFVADVEAICGPAPAGYVKYGCAFDRAGTPVMVVPHPCLVANEFYAGLLCHEQAHWNGWSGKHEL